MIICHVKKKRRKKKVWINPVLGQLRTRINVFRSDPHRVCCILTRMGLKGQGGKKAAWESWWRKSLQSAPAEELFADPDPHWVGMILAKQLREMTAVRQGQTGRDRSLSLSFHSRLSSCLACNGYWFFTSKTKGALSPKVAEFVTRYEKNQVLEEERVERMGECKGRGWAHKLVTLTAFLFFLLKSLLAC